MCVCMPVENDNIKVETDENASARRANTPIRGTTPVQPFGVCVFWAAASQICPAAPIITPVPRVAYLLAKPRKNKLETRQKIKTETPPTQTRTAHVRNTEPPHTHSNTEKQAKHLTARLCALGSFSSTFHLLLRPQHNSISFFCWGGRECRRKKKSPKSPLDIIQGSPHAAAGCSNVIRSGIASSL